MTSLAAYREGVRHLRLSIHRLEESQIAGDPRRGQTKHGGVVIEGDLKHRVFRLPTEREKRKKKHLNYHGSKSI